MARPLGIPKTGGRKKGTPNRASLALREALLFHEIDIVAELAAVLPELDLNKRAEILVCLLSYVYPRRKTVELTDLYDGSAPQVIIALPANGREPLIEETLKMKIKYVAILLLLAQTASAAPGLLAQYFVPHRTNYFQIKGKNSLKRIVFFPVRPSKFGADIFIPVAINKCQLFGGATMTIPGNYIELEDLVLIAPDVAKQLSNFLKIGSFDYSEHSEKSHYLMLEEPLEDDPTGLYQVALYSGHQLLTSLRGRELIPILTQATNQAVRSHPHLFDEMRIGPLAEAFKDANLPLSLEWPRPSPDFPDITDGEIAKLYELWKIDKSKPVEADDTVDE